MSLQIEVMLIYILTNTITKGDRMVRKIKDLSKEEVKQIVDLYNSGLSMVKVGKEVNIGADTISKILHMENVHIRTNREQALKYTCNENYFDVIDTEEKAYWLGFIYADGFIASKTKHQNKKVGITLAIKDEEHLYKFRKAIEGTMPIQNYLTSGGYTKDRPYCRIIISSPHMAEQLILKGVFEHKSLTLKFPTYDIVAKHLTAHFVRGYFDGDGSLKTDGVSTHICGTKEFLNDLMLEVGVKSKLYIKKELAERGVNNYYISLPMQASKIILNYMYKDANIYLDRKYDLYKSKGV